MGQNKEKTDTTLEVKDSEEWIVREDEINVQALPQGEEASDNALADSDDSSPTSVSGTERTDKYKPGVKKAFLITRQMVMNLLLQKATRENTYMRSTSLLK
jgi:hypothetical protein